MRVKKHVSNGQVEFEFGLAMVRRAVVRLNRFAKSVLLDSPSAYVWGDYDESTVANRKESLRKAASEGLKAVSYSDWLEFYTPLCSRGEGGVL